MEMVNKLKLSSLSHSSLSPSAFLAVQLCKILGLLIFFFSSEFCGEENHDVGVSPEGVPKTEMCDYLLEPVEKEEEAEKPDNKKDGGKSEGGTAGKKTTGRSSLVIFAVDISGSMNSTTTVPDLQGQYFQITL